ncbi:hypothetical protein DSO57_1010958 [Entomophthora muscae]|uniref:Uncharacterized protein n=1 Tax=Entomophthora muscae TaxID=34485 RepID=A0ACC2THB0_9FUNG|nr:hypothetical protein DSO57_1010958 [Entomophthora muscae]
MRILIAALTHACLGALTGKQPISTHYYDTLAEYLDTNPVFCGILGSHLNISRITAVQGLTQDQCGTCLRIAGGGHEVYVMAVDKGGAGLDLNKDSFMFLFGEDTGMFEATWEPVDSANCTGIVKGGKYDLPAIPKPPPPSNPSSPYSNKAPPCGWSRCSGPSQFNICHQGVVFSTSCPVDTRCRERGGVAQCI